MIKTIGKVMDVSIPEQYPSLTLVFKNDLFKY